MKLLLRKGYAVQPTAAIAADAVEVKEPKAKP